MARSGPPEYLATADYSLGWGDNLDRSTLGRGGVEAEVMRHAADWAEEMRREGERSSIRRVRVRQWRGHELRDAPVLYEASYYDREQGLTDAEVYAARVHDWHEAPDRVNRRNGWKMMGYGLWSDRWGTEPSACPACGTQFTADHPSST